ncbi:hydroxylysine kinase isoform X2 [Periplaneta americana]
METLEPGQDIRPNLSQQMVVAMIERLYGFKNVGIVELNGYDDRNFHVEIEEYDEDSDVWPHGYVLKVINSLDSQNTSYVDAQTEMALYLGARGVTCPQPVKNLSGNYYSLEEGLKGNKHIVRLLTYQPGQIMNQVPCTEQMFYNIGKFVGLVDEELKGFFHPAYDSNKSVWSLESLPLLRRFTFAVKDSERSSLVNSVIDAFETEVVEIIDTLEKGLIHGDMNEQNVVVSSNPDDGIWDVVALLDFGDTQRSCYVFELAINICYMMLLAADDNPIDAGGHVIAGYNTVRSVPDEEFQILKTCVCGRLCQSLVMGAYSYMQDPGNEYILSSSHKGWKVLEQLWNTPQNIVIDRWKRIITSYKLYES